MNQEQLSYRLYLFFSNIPLCSYYLRGLKQEIDKLLPTDGYSAGGKAVRLLLSKCLLFAIVVLLLCLIMKNRFWVSCIAAGMVQHCYYKKQFRRLYGRILEQFEAFLSDLRHAYHRSGEVGEAFYEAVSEAGYEVSLHLQKFELYLEEDLEEEDYREEAPDRFFIMLLALCRVTMRYGDITGEKGSVFLDNLEELTKEIRLELLRRNKMQHIFSGLFMVTILPMCFLPIIENWSISNLPELIVFYSGATGKFAVLFLTFLTFLVYAALSGLMEGKKRKPAHPLLEKLSEHRTSVKLILFWCESKERTAAALADEIKKLRPDINLSEFMVFRGLCALGGVAVAMIISVLFSAGWYSLVLCPSLLYLSSLCPYFYLACGGLFFTEEKKIEIMQMQAVAAMLAPYQGIGAADILGYLECTCVYYRGMIMECLDRYDSEEEEALEELREKDADPWFRRLTEDLMACDRLGTKQAMEGAAGRREYMLESWKQEIDITLSKIDALAKVLAFVPFAAVTGGYLILPFVWEGMQSMLGYLRTVRQ